MTTTILFLIVAIVWLLRDDAIFWADDGITFGKEEAATFLRTRLSSGATVRLLCDLFHMQIEEADPAATLVACGELGGHVHWADSNRRAVGFGHADMPSVVAALRRIGYRGHLSAEVFPLPTPLEAARQSVESVRALVVV